MIQISLMLLLHGVSIYYIYYDAVEITLDDIYRIGICIMTILSLGLMMIIYNTQKK
jgi:hypothetical protein